MNKYKEMWEKLKSNLSDESITTVMQSYEEEYCIQQAKSPRCSIKIMNKFWYHNYHITKSLIQQKVTRGTVPKEDLFCFNNDFKSMVQKLADGLITDEQMDLWITETHDRYRVSTKKIKKKGSLRYTNSGFERKTKSELSRNDIASIVIDDLVYSITIPAIDKNVDPSKYEDDWKQELWAWCWSYKDKDSNLYNLIEGYNALPPAEYGFYRRNILSRMSAYIVPYIMKLHYSCNNIAKYSVNEKYMNEIQYPSDDLSTIENQYIIDPEEELEKEEDIKLAHFFLDDFGSFKFRPYASSYLRYAKVLEMRYGVNEENKTYTLQEIADYLGVTRERVRQMEVWALRHCRNIIKYKKIRR